MTPSIHHQATLLPYRRINPYQEWRVAELQIHPHAAQIEIERLGDTLRLAQLREDLLVESGGTIDAGKLMTQGG